MITHIVGNRPQFIKLAPLYQELNERGYEQIIIHTGQHYDEKMSGVFFDELNLPTPKVNLGIGSGSHAEMTASAMVGLERELDLALPSVVIIYGDTDSTLAAAISARKLGLPVVHVEGGARTATLNNPEEINRIVADHLSDMIFAPDKASLLSAEHEGLGERTFLVGDIMYDTYLQTEGRLINNKGNDIENDLILMTWHRQENTDSENKMKAILDMVSSFGSTVICPMHPRTVKSLKKYGLWNQACAMDNFKIIDPVGYAEMVSLLQRAKLVVTDSGGLSKESSYAGAKCLFFLIEDVWPDLVNIDWIHLVDVLDKNSINEALQFAQNASKVSMDKRPLFYGDGRTAKKIVDLLEERFMN